MRANISNARIVFVTVTNDKQKKTKRVRYKKQSISFFFFERESKFLVKMKLGKSCDVVDPDHEVLFSYKSNFEILYHCTIIYYFIEASDCRETWIEN